jgi:hypothetical protein
MDSVRGGCGSKWIYATAMVTLAALTGSCGGTSNSADASATTETPHATSTTTTTESDDHTRTECAVLFTQRDALLLQANRLTGQVASSNQTSPNTQRFQTELTQVERQLGDVQRQINNLLLAEHPTCVRPKPGTP